MLLFVKLFKLTHETTVSLNGSDNPFVIFLPRMISFFTVGWHVCSYKNQILHSKLIIKKKILYQIELMLFSEGLMFFNLRLVEPQQTNSIIDISTAIG